MSKAKKQIISNLTLMFDYYSIFNADAPKNAEYVTREEEICLMLDSAIDKVETSNLKIRKPKDISLTHEVWKNLSKEI